MLNEKKFRAIYSELLESGLTIRDYCANIFKKIELILSQLQPFVSFLVSI